MTSQDKLLGSKTSNWSISSNKFSLDNPSEEKLECLKLDDSKPIVNEFESEWGLYMKTKNILQSSKSPEKPCLVSGKFSTVMDRSQFDSLNMSRFSFDSQNSINKKSPEKPCLVSGKFSTVMDRSQFDYLDMSRFSFDSQNSTKKVSIMDGQPKKIRKSKQRNKANNFKMISQDRSLGISRSTSIIYYEDHNLNIEKSLDGKLDSANNDTLTQFLKPLINFSSENDKTDDSMEEKIETKPKECSSDRTGPTSRIRSKFHSENVDKGVKRQSGESQYETDSSASKYSRKYTESTLCRISELKVNLDQIDESQEYLSDSNEDVSEKKQLDDIRNPAETENIDLEQHLTNDSTCLNITPLCEVGSIIGDKNNDSEANQNTSISKKEQLNLPARANNACKRIIIPASNDYIFKMKSNVHHSNKTIGTVGIQDYSDSDYDSDLDQDYQGFNYNIKVHKKISTSRKSMHSPRIPNKRKNDNTVFNIQPYSTNPSNNQSKSTNILYTSDINGNLKQWNYNLKNFDKNWGQIHTSYIYTMAITKDKGFLFTADRNGNVKQWNLLEEKLEHDWGECHSGPIYSIIATSDMNYLITAGRDQSIRKYCLKTRECVKDFGKCHEDWILCMKESSCGQYLFTGSADRQLKQWSIQNESLYHNYGVIDNFGVSCIAVIPAGQFIFTGSDDGHLKQWNISQKKIHKNYKRVHEDCIKAMVATPDSEF